MGYIEKNLLPGEMIVYETRLHWIAIFWTIVLALILGGLGVAAVVRGYEPWASGGSAAMLLAGLVLIFIAVVTIVIGVLRKNSTEVAVSNHRVLIKTGYASRRSVELLLAKVESINVEESSIGRMLGYGTVILRGTGGTFETFSRIAHPNKFRQEVQRQIAK